MRIHVDPASSTPLYAQIMDRVRWGVVTGALQPGDQLPSVRELAARLRVNPNTVVKAYRELEHDAFIETRQGQGSFITADHEATARERRRVVGEALAHAAALALDAGLSPDQLRAMLDEALATLGTRGANTGEVPGDGN